MPSPDLTGYVDLAIYDLEPSTIVDRALLDAATKLPGWVPREGNTEVVLIEALALEVAELVYAINRVPAAVATILLRLFDVERSEGTPPVAEATFTLSDNAGHTVPAGTIVRLDLGGELGPVTFTTDVDLVVAPGNVSGDVAITGTTNTDEANATAIGTPLDLVSSVFFVDAVELAAVVSSGTNPEDATAFLDRGIARLARLTTTLVLPEHFTAAALEEVDVARATTIDLYDGTGTPAGTDAGHVTTAVVGDAGALLSGGRKTEIEATLEALASADLDVHVIDPTITAQDVDVTVMRLAGYTDGEVEQNISDALEAYLSPDTWEWAGTIRRNELIALIDAAAGVDYVEALADPAADVVLAGAAPLADLGALTVTVNAP